MVFTFNQFLGRWDSILGYIYCANSKALYLDLPWRYGHSIGNSMKTDEAIILEIRQHQPNPIRDMWKKYNEFKTVVAHIKNKGAEKEDAEYCRDKAVTDFVINYVQANKPFDDTSEGCIGRMIMKRAELIWLSVCEENKRWYKGLSFEDNPTLQPPDKLEIIKRKAQDEIDHIKNKLNLLSEICQEYLKKRYFEELSLEEMFPLFPKIKNVNTLKVRVNFCLVELRKQL